MMIKQPSNRHYQTVIIMSAIIENLPNELILVIRDYALDLDTRVALLRLAISEIEPGATAATLFRKFTARQLQTISLSCRRRIFEPNTQTTCIRINPLTSICYFHHVLHYSPRRRFAHRHGSRDQGLRL